MFRMVRMVIRMGTDQNDSNGCDQNEPLSLKIDLGEGDGQTFANLVIEIELFDHVICGIIAIGIT